jgi:DNA-binding transcriptional LysR family regulator
MLQQMKTFVCIADMGSISRAARSRRLSVAMASRHLRWLEEEVGATLVRRTTRALSLTEAGREFAARARILLAGIEEAKEIARPGPGAAGRVVVSAPVGFGTYRLASIAPSLAAKHPRVRLELRTEDRAVDLFADGVDLAIRATTPPDSVSLVARRLATYARVVCASPKFLAKYGPIDSLDALAAAPCVLHARGPEVWEFKTPTGPRSISVDGPFCSNNCVIIRDTILAGFGVAWLPEYVVAEDLRKRRLVRLLLHADLPSFGVFGVYHKEARGVVAIRAVLDHIGESLSEPPARGQ